MHLIPQFPTNDSVKDNRFPPVHQHAMLDVPAHSPGQHSIRIRKSLVSSSVW